MKDEKNKTLVLWIIAAIPLLATALVFNRLPDQIPMHWNVHGQIDAYYPKFPWAFMLPVIGILIVFLMDVLPKLDPKRENYDKFNSQYQYIKIFLLLFFIVIQFITIGVSLGATIKVDLIIKLMVGIMFITMGNLMPKFKHNYFVGIKTPWTLANESVWLKTHRHGGFIWFAAGFLLVILSFIPGSISAAIYLGLILTAAFEPIIYSYLLFKKEA
jgi:uncharacterized membrane protein